MPEKSGHPWVHIQNTTLPGVEYEIQEALQLFAQLMTVAKNREKKSIFDAADCRASFSLIPGPIYIILGAFESG
jgi:hypothetical protein